MIVCNICRRSEDEWESYPLFVCNRETQDDYCLKCAGKMYPSRLKMWIVEGQR